jgi:hypothetical protein
MILSRSHFPALASYADDRTATPVGLWRDMHISDSSEMLQTGEQENVDRRGGGNMKRAAGIFLDLIRFCSSSLDVSTYKS